VTNEKPEIVSRTTKAAALRAGILIEKTATTPACRSQAQMFANVPGHNSTVAVAPTAALVIAGTNEESERKPRLTPLFIE